MCKSTHFDVNSGTGTADLNCQQLGDGCDERDATNSCTSCKDSDPTTVAADGTRCNCPNGQYDVNPATGPDGVTCLDLPEGCASGASNNPCMSCLDANAEVDSSNPVCVCSAGFFDVDAATGTTNLDCQPLGEGCDERDASSACTSCSNDGTMEVNEGGTACVCRAGYYDSNAGTGYGDLVCAPLGEGCNAASNDGTCTECSAENAELSGSTCVCVARHTDTEPGTAYNELVCTAWVEGNGCDSMESITTCGTCTHALAIPDPDDPASCACDASSHYDTGTYGSGCTGEPTLNTITHTYLAHHNPHL